jgi:hypothetical protein
MMALTTPPREPAPEPIDDYHVDRETGQMTRPATYHILAIANGLLLIILAAVSFALFWIVATLLGIV